jgi:hypothetical protein
MRPPTPQTHTTLTRLAHAALRETIVSIHTNETPYSRLNSQAISLYSKACKTRPFCPRHAIKKPTHSGQTPPCVLIYLLATVDHACKTTLGISATPHIPALARHSLSKPCWQYPDNKRYPPGKQQELPSPLTAGGPQQIHTSPTERFSP